MRDKAMLSLVSSRSPYRVSLNSARPTALSFLTSFTLAC
jgi:hypothetical protein